MEKFVKLHSYSVGVLTVTVLLNALPRKAFGHVGRQKDVGLDSLSGTLPLTFYEQKSQRLDKPILARGNINAVTVDEIMVAALLRGNSLAGMVLEEVLILM